MRILIVEPKQAPKVSNITGNLTEIQEIVGGLIQIIYPFPERVALICNDEGKLMSLPPNRGLRDENGNLYDIICGTFFLCGVPPDSDNFASLTPEQVADFQERFQNPDGKAIRMHKMPYRLCGRWSNAIARVPYKAQKFIKSSRLANKFMLKSKYKKGGAYGTGNFHCKRCPDD